MDEMIPLGSGRYHVRKFQAVCYSLAPNFGKTFGPSVTTGQSWAFGGASSLSEIGGRERTPKQGLGSETQSEILRGVSV